MTDAPTPEARAVFVPSSRPVVRFVAVLAGVAAVLVVLWWSGLFAARADISVSAGFDPRANTGVAVVMVRNEGPLGAWVGPITRWSRPDSSRYDEPHVRVTGQTPRREVRLDGGDTTRFTVRYVVDCAGYDRARNSERGALSPSLRLRLHAEGVVGSGHSITHNEVALVGACGDPVEPEGE